VPNRVRPLLRIGVRIVRGRDFGRPKATVHQFLYGQSLPVHPVKFTEDAGTGEYVRVLIVDGEIVKQIQIGQTPQYHVIVVLFQDRLRYSFQPDKTFIRGGGQIPVALPVLIEGVSSSGNDRQLCGRIVFTARHLTVRV
jgi:hypothetical protein